MYKGIIKDEGHLPALFREQLGKCQSGQDRDLLIGLARQNVDITLNTIADDLANKHLVRIQFKIGPGMQLRQQQKQLVADRFEIRFLSIFSGFIKMCDELVQGLYLQRDRQVVGYLP